MRETKDEGSGALQPLSGWLQGTLWSLNCTEQARKLVLPRGPRAGFCHCSSVICWLGVFQKGGAINIQAPLAEMATVSLGQPLSSKECKCEPLKASVCSKWGKEQCPVKGCPPPSYKAFTYCGLPQSSHPSRFCIPWPYQALFRPLC